MKKLLIAMTAAAVGTCAWATEGVGGDEGSTPATPTMLNETFGANWTLQAPWSYWSGAEAATPAEGELTVGDALTLNTGSKVLRGAFMSDGSSKDIDTGLFFNATVTFKDPSDTLPTLGAGDKFALVVLDNIESVDAGLATVNTTNLYVIANHGVDGKRAYQLSPAEGIVDLTENWLNTPQTISVKSYKDVLAGDAIRAGLLVKVGNYVCKVFMSYKINENNVIDFTDGYTDGAADKTTAAGYLGYAASDIEGSVRLRYTNQELMLAMVTDTTLASVDFQGQGVIDNVSLATTGDGFGTDSLALTVVPDGVELVDTDETLYFAQIGDTVTIKFSLASGYELKSPAVGTSGLSLDGDVYTYVYTTTANNETVTISAFKPAVSVVVGEETLKFGSLAEALESESVAAGSELKLTAGYTVTEAITLDKNITINLNGQKLSATLVDDFAAMFELADNVTLTITDTKDGILEVIADEDRLIAKGPDRGAANVAIDAGTILADVANENAVTYTLTGGQYDTDVNSLLEGSNYQATKGDDDEYWTVAEKPAAPTTYAVTYTAENATITKDDVAFTSGTELANGDYTFKVAAAEGYDIVSVTVGGSAVELTDGAFSVTVNGAAVAIVVTTREVKYPESEDLVEGDVTTDVAEALDELATALGGDTAVTNYITQVCGGTVDAATLTAAKTAGTIGLSVDYDLPLMAAVPTVSEIEAEAAGADDAAVFSFQINVNATPIEIKQVTDKVRSMIEYGTSLNGMNALTPQDTGVELELSGSTIKVKLLKQNGVKSGFMKVKLNK